MNNQTYSALRTRFYDLLPSDTVTFIFSGVPLRKSADTEYEFHANRNFYYLTGIEEPQAILVYDKPNGRTILFLRDVNELMEKWIGHFMRDEEARQISGIPVVRYLEEFEAYVDEVLNRTVRIGLDLDQNLVSEDATGSALQFATLFDPGRIVNVFDALVTCRLVKHPDEVHAIEKAIGATHESINNMLKEMKPGANEKNMAARFRYEGSIRGGGLMFDTIIASGKNATVLHYIKNDQPLNDGEMVLCDLGIAVNGYGADITRTYPINGRFTDRQKEVYTVVLDTMKAVTAAVRPGVSLLELNELAKEKLAQGCKQLGLIKSSDDIGQYYYHSISHMLGLDTHDVSFERSRPLAVGNVITNEPGLYIAEEELGIRLETDLLVTETGCLDLADQIAVEIDDVEAFLASLM